ncbi:MAG: polysaccharide biosynthesis tyrosine autokinase, partial [Flavobacteriales bacterium]|nr:polysaccharide biosynthesis tyrosine autokinase [Flavobacteriales bacterium]
MAAPGTGSKGGIIDVGDLRYFLRIVSKNWYFVVVALVLSAVLSYLYSYKIPEVYGATAQVLLKDREVYNYQSQVYQNIGYIAAYGDIVNQKRVLTSYDLIDRTLDKLDFDISYYIIGRFKTSQVYASLPFTVKIELLNPKYYQKPFDLRVVDPEHFELSYDAGAGIVAKTYPFNTDIQENEFLLRIDLSSQVDAAGMERLKGSDYQFIRHSRSWMVGRYKESMTIENLEYTTILQITVEDEIPARGKMFLDSLSKVYIDYTLKSEFDINKNTLAYIDKQLDEVSVILDQNENELQLYKQGKNILDLNREESQYFNELVRYENLKRRYELSIASLENLEEYVLNLTTADRLLPPSIYILDDDVYLKSTLTELYSQQMSRNSMLFDATLDNVAVGRLDSTIMLNRGNLLTYIKNSKIAFQQKILDQEQQIADYEAMIRAIPPSQRDILNIQRRVQVNEKMYMFLLEKRANTIIARAGIIPQTKVIESARSIGIVHPDKLKILYTFLVGGLVLSLMLVFVRVMFYDRVENADQLRDLTHAPVYGEIIASEKAEENYVVVDSDPKSAITESFRTVRTNLEYLPATEAGKVVLVTSYRPNEGKTFCSVNLSAILAKAGKKVLLLELDLHKPKVGKGLNMSSPTGLSNLLVGTVDIPSVIKSTQIENFDVILSGPTPPNASELVLSKHLKELLDHARQRYDYIMIDTPPVGLITDALVMMKHADA